MLATGLQRHVFKFLLYDKYHAWPLANQKLTLHWNISFAFLFDTIIRCNQLLLLSPTACVWLRHRFPICSSVSVLFAATSHWELVQMIPLNPSNPLVDTASPNSIGTACVSCSPVYPTAWSNIHPVLLEERQAMVQLLYHCTHWLPHQSFCNPQLLTAIILIFSLRLVAELISTGISSSLSSFQLNREFYFAWSFLHHFKPTGCCTGYSFQQVWIILHLVRLWHMGYCPTAAPPWEDLKKNPSLTEEGEEAIGSDEIEGYGKSWALA